MRTRTITIASHKGGSGKTTTAVALARLLSDDKRVLLIDTDMQCNATEALMSDDDIINYSDYNLYNALTTDALTSNALAITDNLVLVQATAKLAQITNLRADYLRDVLQSQANDYDYVIIDSGPHMSNLNLLAINAADDIIIPTPLSRFGVTSVQKVLTWIEAVNPKANILGLLPTMYDKRKTNQRDNYYTILKAYDNKVLPPIPDRAVIEIIINVPDDRRIEAGLEYYKKIKERIVNATTIAAKK